MQGIASMAVEMLFDYIESKVKEIPDSIKRLLDSPEAKKEVAALWSEKLYEQGVIPKGYAGLPDDLLIHNFHQDGYLEGMYAGYLITITALAEKGVSKEDLLDAREIVMPRFFRKSYEDRKALFDQLESEMQEWVKDTKPQNVD